MNLRSIRWQLPLSYAGIALLAALALGTILLITLKDYYERLESNYLLRNADSIRASLVPALDAGVPASVLEAQVKSLAFFAQARVRLLDRAGNVIIDSGPPAGLDVLAFSPLAAPFERRFVLPQPGEGIGGQFPRLEGRQDAGAGPALTPVAPVTPAAPAGPARPALSLQESGMGAVYLYAQPVTTGVLTSTVEVVVGGYGLVSPIPETMAYFSPGPASEARRSSQEASLPLVGASQRLLGTVLLSDGPAYGSQIVDSVARAWVAAGLAAVLLAAGAGWLASRRVTRPLRGLAEVTARMASGELSARADGRPADEFGALGRSFNEMAARVETTVEALRRFVSDAAHELQTPLTALGTNLELGRAESRPDRRTEYLERAQTQVERLGSLVQGLLDLSRLEAGAGVENWELVDLGILLQAASERSAAQAEQKGQEFTLELAPDLPPVRGNPAQLERAVGNLLDNALKFTPTGGAVRAGAAPAGAGAADYRRVRLWVEDTGIGIPPGDLDRLFERFHRGRNASAYPGSGLGLAIVKAIVVAHGGRVAAENRVEIREGEGAGGARFTIELPGAERGGEPLSKT